MKRITLFALCVGLFAPISCGGNSNNQNGQEKDKSKASVGAVDLGLSVKWASCNVGAKSEWEIGDYFAWGEVQPKASYLANNYKHRDADGNWIKYAFKADALVDADVAKADNQATLLPEDDAASALHGDGWRMPTPEEASQEDEGELGGRVGFQSHGTSSHLIILV